jgi:hypothetical protein
MTARNKLVSHHFLALRPEWQDENTVSNCAACNGAFSLFNRKHHCRRCGKVFCTKCSDKKAALRHYGYDTPQRVCETCYELDKIDTTMGINSVPTQQQQQQPSPINTTNQPSSSTLTINYSSSLGQGSGTIDLNAVNPYASAFADTVVSSAGQAVSNSFTNAMPTLGSMAMNGITSTVREDVSSNFDLNPFGDINPYAKPLPTMNNSNFDTSSISTDTITTNARAIPNVNLSTNNAPSTPPDAIKKSSLASLNLGNGIPVSETPAKTLPPLPSLNSYNMASPNKTTTYTTTTTTVESAPEEVSQKRSYAQHYDPLGLGYDMKTYELPKDDFNKLFNKFLDKK